MCKQFILASVGVIAMTGSAFAAEPAPYPRRRFRSSPGLVSISAGRSVTPGVKTMFLGPEPPMILIWPAVQFGEGPQGVIGGAHLGYNIQPNHGLWLASKRPWTARACAKLSSCHWRTSRETPSGA